MSSRPRPRPRRSASRSTVWRAQALATRNKFEAARGLKEEGAINAKVKEAQKWIKDHWHPDPYNSEC